MNVIIFSKRRACLVVAWAMLVGQASFAGAQTVLIDFGSNTSFRGLSVNNPDTNGNYWNSVQPGLLVTDLAAINNAATTIDLGWATPVGTDSYNGPAGPTDAATLHEDVMFTDIDAAALGNLGGALEAAFDFAAGYNGVEHFPVRFELQGLNPAATYDLTFFGSHSFSNSAKTIYTVYTDDTYTTPVASTELFVQDEFSFFTPNRDRVATITGVAPQADDILYIEFKGENNFGGYLNSLQIVSSAAPEINDPDFNNNNLVEGQDFLIWQRGFGIGTGATNAQGDANGDLAVNATDFNLWKAKFGGAPANPVAGAVPEPAGVALLLVGSTVLSLARRRRR